MAIRGLTLALNSSGRFKYKVSNLQVSSQIYLRRVLSQSQISFSVNV